MSAIDSTMAIGFYCHSPEELRDLCEQVSSVFHLNIEYIFFGFFDPICYLYMMKMNDYRGDLTDV